MAVHSLTEVLDNVGSSTVEARLPGLIDQVFTGDPLLARLMQRNKVVEDGGDEIRQRIIYAKKNGGSYSGLDTFNSSETETRTMMKFDWKQYYVDITLSGLSMLKNAGGKKIADLVQDEMDEAEMKAADMLATDIFLDGTANGSKTITGLRAACDNGDLIASYGGITRSATTNTPGYAVRGNVTTTAITFSLATMQTYFGSAGIGNEYPDLIVTTQTLWNKWWERAQPSQRFEAGSASNMASIGFNSIKFNNAEVVVDNHCPAGYVFFLNTKFIKFIVHKERMWTPTPWKYPTNQDAAVKQLLFAGELVVTSPRLQYLLTNVS